MCLILFIFHFLHVFTQLTSILVTLVAASAAVQETSCKSSRKALLRPVDKSSTNVRVKGVVIDTKLYHQIIEGSLEVKLPTIWTVEKHSQEETRTWRKSEGRR